PAATQQARAPHVPPHAPPLPPPYPGCAAAPPLPTWTRYAGLRLLGRDEWAGHAPGAPVFPARWAAAVAEALGRDQRGQCKRLGSRPSRQDGVSSREGPPPHTPRPGKRCAGARRSSDSPSRAAATAPAERGRKTKPQAASRALCLRRCKRDPASGFSSGSATNRTSSLVGRLVHSFRKAHPHACINTRSERTRTDAQANPRITNSDVRTCTQCAPHSRTPGSHGSCHCDRPHSHTRHSQI
ncbi:uncharacterized protein LOC103161373, partial [Cricetulus griseus]|uniref:uncharacterized protein LOC103161373 n=1 Tax=Cricetulus griseus TaxID=10029 RepID=UPI0015C34A3F